MRLVVLLVALVVASVAAAPAVKHQTANPYVGPESVDFLEDLSLVHGVLKRERVPRFHGGSRPFFETITNALSDAEKAAFDRLSQGLLPDNAIDGTEELPTHLPLYLRPCERSEEDLLPFAIMQMESLRMTVDPKHIKLKLNMTSSFKSPLHMNLTYHTVVTVAGASIGGYHFSPMVLFDKSGTVCDLFDNMLGCPIPQGRVNIVRKVKVPGIDAVSILPKRLYDAQVEVFDNDSLVSCQHVMFDLRTEEEQEKRPVVDGVPVEDFVIETEKNRNTTAPRVDSPPAPPVLPPTEPQTVSLEPVPQIRQGPVFAHEQGTSSSRVVLSSEDGLAPLDVLKSIGNVQKEMSASSNANIQETAMLQQFQLHTLQEQLQKQQEINRKQQVEYSQLKEKLTQLAPSEVESLKRTVSELISVQQERTEEEKKQIADTKKEQQLYQQLQSLYQRDNLPIGALPFTMPMMNPNPMAAVPHLPNMFFPQPPQAVNPLNTARASQHRLPDLQFLSQVDTLLGSENSTGLEFDNATALETADNMTEVQNVEADINSTTFVEPPVQEQPAPVTSGTGALAQNEDQEADLPDVSNILPSEPKFVDNKWGESFVLEELPAFVSEICVPFVTLASDLSFSFCIPTNWKGKAAIVVTEPFTGEKGFFAELASVTSPIMQSNTTEQNYPIPRHVGLNELLLDRGYATIVVTFNADTFVENVGYSATEIMGAYAAFVDYAGLPSTTVVTGVGWGGVLATQLLERHGGCRLHGGLVLDSPIGSARWQGDYYGDILSFFEWVSPKAYSAIMDHKFNALSHLLLESWEEIGRPYIFQALAPIFDLNDTAEIFTSPRAIKTLEMMRALNIKCAFTPEGDSFDNPVPQCLHDELANAIRKAAMYISSYRLMFKGQDPFDNYRTLYIPEKFIHLNEDISRKMADEAPMNHQTRFLETSGMLRVPLILLNTPQNPEVPDWQGVEYMRKQKQICENNGIGVRVVNDTIDAIFGHAHTEATGTEMSQQIDIMQSMMEVMRTVDDSALTQRSWVKQPLKMVDPQLAECPFQAKWYLQTLASLKKSIKSGRIQSKGGIQELIGANGGETSDLDSLTKEVLNTDTAIIADSVAGTVASTGRNTAGGVAEAAGNLGNVAGNSVGQADEVAGNVAQGVNQAGGAALDLTSAASNNVAGAAVAGFDTTTGAVLPSTARLIARR